MRRPVHRGLNELVHSHLVDRLAGLRGYGGAGGGGQHEQLFQHSGLAQTGDGNRGQQAPDLAVVRAQVWPAAGTRVKFMQDVHGQGGGGGVVEDEGGGQRQAGGGGEPVAELDGGQGVEAELAEFAAGIDRGGGGVTQDGRGVGLDHAGQVTGVPGGRHGGELTGQLGGRGRAVGRR